MANMQTFLANNLEVPFIRAFSTKGSSTLGDIYNPSFNTSIANPRYFKATGPDAKYIPVDFLPLAEHCIDHHSSVLNGVSDIAVNNSSKKFLPIIEKLLLDKPLTIRNVEWWSNVIRRVENSQLMGWTTQELEVTARLTYQDEPIKFSEGEFNRNNFLTLSSGLPTPRISLREESTDYYCSRMKHGCTMSVLSNETWVAYMNSNHLMYGDYTVDCRVLPLAYCVMLKAEYFQDWLTAYENQIYTDVNLANAEWKYNNSRLEYGYRNVPVKQVIFNPKWFTVVYVEDLYKKIKNSSPNKRHLRDYKTNFIDVALKAGMNLDTSIMSFNDISSPVMSDIKSYLKTGLKNYAKESRDFLFTLSQIE